MSRIQLKTRLLLEVTAPDLGPTKDAEPRQFPNRVVASVPEEFQVLAVRTGTTWVEVSDGEQPSEEDLRSAARSVLTEEMLSSRSVTVSPTGTIHIEWGPLWRPWGSPDAQAAGGTEMTLFALGVGEDGAFEPFGRPMGSGGGDDPIEQAVLRVSIAVSRA